MVYSDWNQHEYATLTTEPPENLLTEWNPTYPLWWVNIAHVTAGPIAL